jgi:Uma2 family endonuclease
MTVTVQTPTYYPNGDGQPVAETFAHFYAIAITVELLRLFLQGQQATVLGNQFLYYAEGEPKKRVAPDVMVIFDVEPGGRDSYKIWEENAVPSIVFEMTSPATQKEDETTKKQLYAELGIMEYWQFDPKGEWIPQKLRGYYLERGVYQPVIDSSSNVLKLRLAVDDSLTNAPTALIAFYHLDSEEKLLVPAELQTQILLEKQRTDIEKQRADVAERQTNLERQRADAAEQRVKMLEDLLSQGRSSDPDSRS